MCMNVYLSNVIKCTIFDRGLGIYFTEDQNYTKICNASMIWNKQIMQILIFLRLGNFFTVKYDVRQLNVIDLVCYGTKMDYSQTGYCTADIHKQLKFRNSIVFRLPKFSIIKKQSLMFKIEEKWVFFPNDWNKSMISW